jgi:hypothetical protein
MTARGRDPDALLGELPRAQCFLDEPRAGLDRPVSVTLELPQRLVHAWSL